MTGYSIKRYNKYSDTELIQKLVEYAQSIGCDFISSFAFSEATGIAESTISNHFGSWKVFCQRSGLYPRYDRQIDKTVLLANLDRVWQALNRQPRAKEMKQPLSPISVSRYQKVFQKPWYDICAEFLSWKSGGSSSEIEKEPQTAPPIVAASPHTTRRGISLSLRYEILNRDGFRCVKCGQSPATDRGIELHIYHIVSWANGGETTSGNLQTLCSDCNTGKSNRFDG